MKNKRKSYAAGMSSAIGDLTHGGREMIETAIQIMRSELEDGNVRMKAIEFLTERLAGKSPITIEVEQTATMLAGRNLEELSDSALDRVLGVIDAELGPDEPAELVQEAPVALLSSADVEPTLEQLETAAAEEIEERETASVLDSILGGQT